MRAKGIAVVFALTASLVSGAAFAADGVYTDKQAEDGHVKFNNNCAQCHGPKLDGALGPNLHDAKFQAMFADKPVKNLRDFVYENMPQNAPKSLTDDNLYPILAWILKKNNVPARPCRRARRARGAPRSRFRRLSRRRPCRTSSRARHCASVRTPPTHLSATARKTVSKTRSPTSSPAT